MANNLLRVQQELGATSLSAAFMSNFATLTFGWLGPVIWVWRLQSAAVSALPSLQWLL